MKIKASLFLAGAIVNLASCRAPETSTSNANIKSVVHEAGAWDKSDPPVCLMNREDVSKDAFKALKNHAVTQFSRAGVTLSEWHDCRPAHFNRNMIRIAFAIPGEKEDKDIWGGGFVNYVGMTSKGIHRRKPYYTTLSNFEALEDGSFDYGYATLVIFVRKVWPKELKYQNVQLSAFLHELGHHVGLQHEHNHTENTSSFPKDPYYPKECKDIGLYDPKSMMSYTRDRYVDINFTDGDLEGLKYLFRNFL